MPAFVTFHLIGLFQPKSAELTEATRRQTLFFSKHAGGYTALILRNENNDFPSTRTRLQWCVVYATQI